MRGLLVRFNKPIAWLLLLGFIFAGYLIKQIWLKTNLSINRQLIVGTAAGYAPFVSININGDYEGFDIDVARLLAQELGKELVIRDLGSMTSLLMALDQKQVDLVIWGLSITQDRLKKISMVHYYGASLASYPLVFWQEIPAGVKGLHDLAGQTVCVEPGSAQEAVLDQYGLINKLPVEKIDDALLNIQYGKAVAALIEPVIAKKFSVKYPQIKTIDVLLAPNDQEQGLGIAMKQDRVELVLQIQQAIKKLKDRGSLLELACKWGLDL